ncbi:ACT domain-containing protein [Pseudoalteromonas sp. SMS1]|uniref:ACT domain-containing protein n=1 Tax=Pseudoalteromonas sp. SMS1 TaxID=2908894 RepID=UPI001F33C9B8|nr:ACT domain-containing protein [Pseudoalteromonas sp. SMS1]MCF2856388.1 ACT domain-containing protein [Pseudoalteromonas sp. SMS1]
MVGETRLSVLLSSMEPELLTEEFAFAVVDEAALGRVALQQVKGLFREQEGVTIIMQQPHAAALGLKYEGGYRCITLNVHSSLEAVGLTAAFANALGNENISANVVAGFYHDHIFVPCRDAQKALACLTSLARYHQGG